MVAQSSVKRIILNNSDYKHLNPLFATPCRGGEAYINRHYYGSDH